MKGCVIKKALIIAMSLLFAVLSSHYSYSLEIRGGTFEEITGKVTFGEFTTGLCISTPLNVDMSCINRYYENESINCSVFSTSHNITNFSSVFIEGTPIYTINKTTGTIYKEILNFSDVGLYLVLIYFKYTNECGITESVKVHGFNVVRISNRPPICHKDIENVEITQGSGLLISMGTYCEDPDLDPLNYTVWVDKVPLGFSTSIINDKLSLTTDWFYGDIYLSFNATDNYNTSDSTNTFKITVKPKQPYEQPEPTISGMSTKNSFSGSLDSLNKTTTIMCLPKWECKEWGVCLPQGYQERECNDLNNCNVTFLKPEIIQNCTYTPTCFNGIKDGDEQDTDCGGQCAKECTNILEPQTCFDGIKDGDEQDIDCGGQCANKCLEPQTCFNGIKDGDEQDTDCGGQCANKCPVIQQPLVIKSLNNIWLISIISSILIIGYYFINKLPRRVKFRKIKKIMLNRKNNNDLMLKLDDIEKNIQNTKIKITLSKISKVIESYLLILLDSEHIFTEDELRKKIADLKIKNNLKEFIIEIYNDMLELEFSEKEISRMETLLLIYESKNLIRITIPPKEYVIKELTILKPIEKDDDIFKLLIIANYDLLKDVAWNKDKLKELKKVLLSKNIKNKFLINSYNRLLKMELNKYEEKK